MSAHLDGEGQAQHERFRLQFQRRLREYLARNPSPAEGFNLVWEKTLEECPVAAPQQPQLHWEMVQWARGYDLFTTAESNAVVPAAEK
ncbi:MAG: hypothetical protein U1G07_15570 [Verrucomicrobiota bacterium]